MKLIIKIVPASRKVPLGPNIPRSTLFSKTLSVWYSDVKTKIQVKVKLSLRLTKYHTIRNYSMLN